jgi:uncharacterized membrane protein
MRFVRASVLLSVALFCGGILAVAGCDSGPSTVSGKVTLDGAPLKKGTISFLPSDGLGPTAGASVSDGAYSAEVFPGAKRVEIRGYEVIGQEPAYGDPNGPMKDITKSLVPPKYNDGSSLTADIQSGANENVNFEVTSK